MRYVCSFCNLKTSPSVFSHSLSFFPSMNLTDILNVTDAGVHGLATRAATHAVTHATFVSKRVSIGLEIGAFFVLCCCFCMCYQCVCGKGVSISARPPVREYEGLPLIRI